MPRVFTYGPDALQGRMFDRIGPSDFVGGAILEGYRMAFDKPNIKASSEGFANLHPDPEGEVFGAVFELTKQQLDLLDGFFGGYAQRDVSVRICQDGEPGARMKAVTWVGRRTREGLEPNVQTVLWARQALEENQAPERFASELPEVELPPDPEPAHRTHGADAEAPSR